MNNPKLVFLTYLKGLTMGAADIVPGVSGGSIALITGIYEKLLDSIKAIDQQALKLLFSGQWKVFWTHINGGFLLTLLSGILTSILTLSKFITYLIAYHPIPIWSFFCGLIIVSAMIILRDIKRWTWGVVLAFLIGVIAAYWVTGLPVMTSPSDLWFVFIAGAIAICAMILPGISGSFLLLILGQYERILAAVAEKNLLILGLFALGCLTGLLSFSRLISYLLKKFHFLTIAVLSGFMLGSINKIWPWKVILSYRINSKGIQQPFLTENILPKNYFALTGQESLLLHAITAFLFGIILVLGIERMALYLKKR